MQQSKPEDQLLHISRTLPTQCGSASRPGQDTLQGPRTRRQSCGSGGDAPGVGGQPLRPLSCRNRRKGLNRLESPCRSNCNTLFFPFHWTDLDTASAKGLSCTSPIVVSFVNDTQAGGQKFNRGGCGAHKVPKVKIVLKRSLLFHLCWEVLAFKWSRKVLPP